MDAIENQRTPWMHNLVRVVLSGCLIAFSPQITAQEGDEVEEVKAAEGTAVTDGPGTDALMPEVPTAEEETRIEEIVVTGSRIQRNEFSSISPVQLIQGERSRELGMIDTAGIIQGSTAASGVQIDNTFTSFVLDNGPGSANVNLRGLGAARSLLLINSRRMAPSGVGGAPTAADLNSLPSIMIDRVEVLSDGASSVYGSDAVGGVVNVLMRRQFEGLEFEVDRVSPDANGAQEGILSLAWGRDFDRGSIGVGAEFYDRGSLQYEHRSHTRSCNKYLYVDENDRILGNDLSLVPGTTIDECKLRTINRVFLRAGPFGNIWYTPGRTNIGIPNFSETTVSPGLAWANPSINPVDGDGDGVPDFGIIDPDGNGETEVDLKNRFFNYNGSSRDRAGDYLAELQRANLYSFGYYELQDANNTSLSFELLYNQRELAIFSPGASIAPDVPGTNPYNPCNQQAPGGVNCWAFFVHPVFGPFNFGNIDAVPIVLVRGDRDAVAVEQEQVRTMAAIEGHLPWGTGWSYEVFGILTKSDGSESRDGILEAPLELSIQTSAVDPNTGNIVCGADNNGDGIPDGQGCVPVNMFASSLYQSGGGEFATQAERDFLFGERTFNTVFEQTILGAIVQGDVWHLPWNGLEVPLVLGVEYRIDDVDSQPNEVARDGLLYGYFSDRGALGSRNLQEAYLETEFRLLEGKSLADELLINVSGRWTKESTYGSHFTHSTKIRYSPIESLDFRATRGTSFRAPNAREQFLLGQSGFLTLFDPCVVPTEARIPSLNPNEPPMYNPDMDDRPEITLDNCRSNGVDPLTLGLATNSVTSYSVEIFRVGGDVVQATIDPETSTATTAGMVFRQPWFDAFSLSLSGTYWRFEIEDSISLLSSQFFIFDCYQERAGNTSAYCRFINRDENGFIDNIDSSYFNVHQELVAGWDWNVLFEKTFIVRDRNLNLALDVRATRTNRDLFVLDEVEEDYVGRTSTPQWRGAVTLQVDYNDVRFNWRASYIDGGEEEPLDFDTYDPCFGLDVLCRPVFSTSSTWMHTMSASWRPGDWRITTGIRNVFNDAPPLLDTDAPGTQVNNVPLGVYDLNHHVGRAVFFGVSRSLSLATRARGY